MDGRIKRIKSTMFEKRVKSYQVSKALNIPDCTLSRMLNEHIDMQDEIYQKIVNYLDQYGK